FRARRHHELHDGDVEGTVDSLPTVYPPNSEAQALVPAALAALHDGPRAHGGLVVDTGTGTSVIAVAIARAPPSARVIAMDPLFEAVLVARLNARRAHARNVVIRRGSLLAPLRPDDGRALGVISNVPFVVPGDSKTEKYPQAYYGPG